MSPAKSETIHLVGGDVLHGEIVEQTDTSITINHPVLGVITLDRQRIASIQSAPDDAADTNTAPETVPPPITDADLIPPSPAEPQPTVSAPAASQGGPGADAAQELIDNVPEEPTFQDWLKEWDSKLELGISGFQGNTESESYLIAFNGARRNERDRTSISSRWFYQRSGDRTTQQELVLKLEQDWFIPDSPFFPFVRAEYEYDDFQLWRSRAQAYVGVGLTLLEQDALEANLRIAGGAVKEFEGQRDFRPEGLLGVAVVKWHPWQNHTISGSATYYPNLEDTDNFRLVTALEWQMQLSSDDNVGLKLGIENEYDSNEPGSDTDQHDLKYYAAMVFNF